MKLQEFVKKHLNRIVEFGIYSKTFFFIIAFLITVIFLRLGTLIYNPNPVIFHFELHHFDYGLLLMMFSVLFLIFDDNANNRFLYIIASAVSFGLVIDGIWFVRSLIVEPAYTEQMLVYGGTIVPTILLVIVVIIGILWVDRRVKKKGFSKTLERKS